MSGELLVLSGLGGFVALWGGQLLRTWWVNQHQQEQVLPATVLEKSLVHEPGSGWDPAERFVVTFALPDGSRRHFAVTEGQYKHVHAGDQGHLHTRGSSFRGFE